ncbi:hypothetical protein JHJ32_07305 [Parapedobacter sp. ISTM3]|uniref:hypothetical protein n=1 Tax=Parapedobacter sp. ISTM3 TaxID=2800130 RepID=UPI0019038A6B|nr:hypothetical protein [Parapedobacter sp. ISTM3]MBK1439784.1 hypothetical protein [Parapedobacter sp. ISTM3]
MKSELPIVSLAGDEFYLESKGLRYAAAPQREIPFDQMARSWLKAMDSLVRRFMYDTVGKSIADISSYTTRVPETVKYLEIPEIFILGLAEEELAGILKSPVRDDWALYVQDHCLTARELPRVKLMGTEFILDTLNGELMEMLNMKNRISFESINVFEHNKEMFFDYNVQTNNIAQPGDDPDAVTIAFLKPMHESDPKAWDLIVKPEDRVSAAPQHHEVKPASSKQVKPKKGKGLW